MVDFPNGVSGVRALCHAAVEVKQELDYATTLLLLAVAAFVSVHSMSYKSAMLKIVVSC